MAAISSFDPRFNLSCKNHNQNGVLVEEIEGLIRLSKDGHVERPAIIPTVPSTWSLDQNLVTSKDIMIDKVANLWARIYVPTSSPGEPKPLLVYFHGGGFCVGSTAWSCYHEFLANLSTKANCVIISVNYRLAPENRLPGAYEDGFNALMWIKNQAQTNSTENRFWSNQCNTSRLFLAGDSAGANIAYHVTTRLASLEDTILRPFLLKGTILIQPFFGGESRTESEKYSTQPPNSALTLSTSDTYWRLSLPLSVNRDHPWCNPLANINNGSAKLKSLAVMVCVSETDILKDRNLEFCNALVSSGKNKVEMVMYKGVGHAFQILHNSNLSQARTQEMMSHIKTFINQ